MKMMTNNPWLVVRKPNRWADLRLFCFPYSGAGASIFNRWAERLPYQIELCAVQPPGRETRMAEPLFTRLTPLVQTMAQALLPYLDKPFAFFGHSLGTLISFELARHLRREHGLQPVYFFASGHGAPQMPKEKTPIHDLPEPAFTEALRLYNGTPDEVLEHPELRQLLFPILRADFAIYESYVYTDDLPLACPLTVFGGLQDDISHAHLDAWREQTANAFSVKMFPGNHFFLNTAQNQLLYQVIQQLRDISSKLAVMGQQTTVSSR